MIRNTFTQSGELAIISGVKFFVPKFIKSLQVRVTVILSVFVILSSVILMNAILQSYDQRTVSVRTAEIQNQCTILSNQLVNSDYLKTGVSDVIDTELSQLSNIYNGRVLVIDDEFRIVEDTYDLEEGKTIISEDVVKCFRGEKPASYDRKSRYIEVAVPVKKGEEPVKGMILVSVSTDSLRDNVEALQSKARIATVAISIIGIFLAAIIGMLLVRPLKRMSQSIEEMAGCFNKLWDRYKVLDASREEFVANVSHELKTPLTSMKVLADSLLMQPDAPTEIYREFMGDLSEEIERENKIINDLLDLVKLDKKGANLNIKSQDVNELVERILKRLQPLAAKSNIELVFESFRPVTAEIDEVKIALVITNLVENAIKYNKENGWVHVSLNADHKYFYLKVADSGIGIPKEDTDHIFERFFRVDKSHSREIGGTGLGLSIARNAVVMHRGAIKVYSEPGEGTTFTVRIPLTYIKREG